MNGDDVRKARHELGESYGLGRPLDTHELALILRLRGKDPGELIRDWERGRAQPTGPASVVIEMLLDPDEEQVNDAVAALDEVMVGETSLKACLAEAVGETAAAEIIEDIVFRVADVMREPPTLKDALNAAPPVIIGQSGKERKWGRTHNEISRHPDEPIPTKPRPTRRG